MLSKEKKARKQKIYEIDHRAEIILQASIDGFCVIGTDGAILDVNPAYCAISGYSKEELVGNHLADIEAIETREQISEHIREVIEKGYCRFETKHQRKDGTILDIEVSSQFCDHEKDKFFFSFFRDITEQKQLACQLEIYKDKVLKAQNHAYIASMGAIVAHQLNQPLTIINMRLGKALEIVNESNCSPKCLSNVKESLAEAKRAAAIIKKFRQCSKDPALETTGKVNISNTTNRMVTMLSEKAEQAKIDIFTKNLKLLPEVEINETALEQILYIIVQNAIEAANGRKRHTLDILGKCINGSIELQFADDCGGISPEILEKIFEPFFSTKSDDKGIGLGLDIVQQILMSCSGEISVESVFGKGAAFYVTLPISNNMIDLKNNEK